MPDDRTTADQAKALAKTACRCALIDLGTSSPFASKIGRLATSRFLRNNHGHGAATAFNNQHVSRLLLNRQRLERRRPRLERLIAKRCFNCQRRFHVE